MIFGIMMSPLDSLQWKVRINIFFYFISMNNFMKSKVSYLEHEYLILHGFYFAYHSTNTQIGKKSSLEWNMDAKAIPFVT
jgi:hypothetical protein